MKTSIRFLLVVFFCLSSEFHAAAQFQDLQFAYITAEDGLSSNSVWCILQDKQGFMWFGTSQGLNDGMGTLSGYFVNTSL